MSRAAANLHAICDNVSGLRRSGLHLNYPGLPLGMPWSGSYYSRCDFLLRAVCGLLVVARPELSGV